MTKGDAMADFIWHDMRRVIMEACEVDDVSLERFLEAGRAEFSDANATMEHMRLKALESAGVADWGGYPAAMELLSEMSDGEERPR